VTPTRRGICLRRSTEHGQPDPTQSRAAQIQVCQAIPVGYGDVYTTVQPSFVKPATFTVKLPIQLSSSQGFFGESAG